VQAGKSGSTLLSGREHSAGHVCRTV
jgi:hypothetical protein